MNRRKRFALYIGSFAVTLTLMLVMIFPVFGGKSGIEQLQDWLNQEIEKSPLSANDTEEPHPFYYEHFTPPANSFGIGETDFTHVNWAWVENHTTYLLTCNGENKDYLFDCNFSYVFTYRKYSYWFTADTKGYYEFTLVFDSMANNSYIDDMNHTVFFEYGENEVLFYNFSDIWDIVGQFDSSFDLTDNVFTMILGRNCNKNVKIELDPYFGDKDSVSTVSRAGNFIWGYVFTMGAVGGTADDICCHFSTTENCKLMYLIFENSTNNLVGHTVCYDGSFSGWKSLAIDGDVTLEADTDYMLCFWVEDAFGVYYTSIAGYGDSTYDMQDCDPPATSSIGAASYMYSIYCNYTTGGGASWQPIVTTINGTYTNTTYWEILDSTINGTYTNVTKQRIIDSDINGTYTNTTQWEILISTINGTYTNDSDVWYPIVTGINGTYTNGTSWKILITTINGTYTNTTRQRIIDATINGTYTNGTAFKIIISTINGTYTNDSDLWYQIVTGINGTYTNDSDMWYQIITGINGTYTNTTKIYLTITDEYPENGSIDAEQNTSLYANFTSESGLLLNITFYYGNFSVLINTLTNVTSGIYYSAMTNATGNLTTYWWSVRLNDGTHYLNNTFNFTTEGGGGGGSKSTLGILAACMFVAFSGFIFVYLVRKKRRYE